MSELVFTAFLPSMWVFYPSFALPSEALSRPLQLNVIMSRASSMRIIDFGSGIDEFTLRNLYGSTGPSRAEQTYEYTPPEALLNATWYQGPTSSTLKYDIWSVGVVMLELVLGTPNVFQINALTRALLDQHLEGWNEGVKELAYKLEFHLHLGNAPKNSFLVKLRIEIP
ncbi:unnamed protein product [Sphenostylis stenocarpa]|uniref:Protein kinase domain-containing protein n=1 Tax=Sphenostylis stenocarpa TaxID=92480 RepID=A0AA86T266_9FABA|nr:unnamed protein product [Sphenostylis stenocarpa]